MIRRELAGLIWFEAQVIRERSQVAWLAFDRAEVVNSSQIMRHSRSRWHGIRERSCMSSLIQLYGHLLHL